MLHAPITAFEPVAIPEVMLNTQCSCASTTLALDCWCANIAHAAAGGPL